MRLLLDTHFIIWMALDAGELRPSEAEAFYRRRGKLVASVISLWEIRTKWAAFDRRGHRKGVLSPLAAADFLHVSDIAIEPLTSDVALTPLKTETDHTDPFDRMLLVHAQHLGARLLTRDRKLAAHPLSLPL